MKKFWTTAELIAAGKTMHSIRTAVRQRKLVKVVRGHYISVAALAGEEATDLLMLQALTHAVPGLVYGGSTAAFLYREGTMQWPAHGILPRGRSGDGGEKLRIIHRQSSRNRSFRDIVATSPLETAVDLHLLGGGAGDAGDVVGAADAADTPGLRDWLRRAYSGHKANDILALDLAALPPRRRAVAAELLDGVVTGTASNLEKQVAEAVTTELPDVTMLVNGMVRGYRFDLVFPEARVVVEIDSWMYHSAETTGRKAFTRDRWKGNAAARFGWTLLRYSDWDITTALDLVVAEIVDTVRYNLAYPRGRRLRTADDLLPTDREVWLWHPGMDPAMPPDW